MFSTFKRRLKRILPFTAYLEDQKRRKLITQEFWKWTSEDENSYLFYQQFIKPGDTVFDVGANRGNRARIFAKLKAFVVMVEPQTTCAEYLRMVFCHTNNWVLIEGALGQSEYEQEMLLSSAETLSTFSTQWVQAVKESGRFSQCDWNKRQKIRMTTLDSLIHRYGPPSFVKIDVEGYEREVLSGLSIPLTAVSLEFTPEFISSTFSCIEHLSSLADFEFQISLGETMAMALPEWVSGTALKEHLSKISANSGNILFGDVYAKKKSGSR